MSIAAEGTAGAVASKRPCADLFREQKAGQCGCAGESAEMKLKRREMRAFL